MEMRAAQMLSQPGVALRGSEVSSQLSHLTSKAQSLSLSFLPSRHTHALPSPSPQHLRCPAKRTRESVREGLNSTSDSSSSSRGGNKRPAGARCRHTIRREYRPRAPRARFAEQWDIDGTYSKGSKGPLSSGQRGPGVADKCLLHTFSWTSHQKRDGKTWYQVLLEQVDEIEAAGFTDVLLPPPCSSQDPQGLSIDDFYDIDSSYGTSQQLKTLTTALRLKGIAVGVEMVLARGFNAEQAQLNTFHNTVEGLGPSPLGSGAGSGASTAGGAATIVMDHASPFVEADCKGWMLWLQEEYGFSSWRFDLAAKLDPAVVASYCEDTTPAFSVADMWRTMRYNGPSLEYDQDSHRQDLANWARATRGSALVLDYTTKGILQRAVENCEYWRLIDPNGHPPGLIGLQPSAAVTFVENHFTGSELQLWPFPSWGVMVGYAYILTHPGIPSVFYDHMFDWQLKEGICDLLRARQRNGINMLSKVNILLCGSDIYVARIGENVEDADTFRGVVLKIGPAMDMRGTCPDETWKVAASGLNYCVWERS